MPKQRMNEPPLFAWLFAPQPIARLELVRIGAPLAILGFLSTRIAHADEWLSTAGFHAPEIPGGDWRQPLYIAPLSPGAAWAMALLMVIAGLGVAVGFRARAAALLFAVLVADAALIDRLAAFTVTKLAPAVLLALAVSPCGQRWSVDAWLARRKGRQTPIEVSGGAVRFFQILLAVFYCASGLAKARGGWLSHPLVLWTHVHDSYQTAMSWAVANAAPAWLWTLLQAGTLGFEVGAPLWLGWAKTRRYAVVWAVAMHLLIGALFWPVRWFSLLMIVLVVASYAPLPDKIMKAISSGRDLPP
jgi:hypothetical protein